MGWWLRGSFASSPKRLDFLFLLTRLGGKQNKPTTRWQDSVFSSVDKQLHTQTLARKCSQSFLKFDKQLGGRLEKLCHDRFCLEKTFISSLKSLFCSFKTPSWKCSTTVRTAFSIHAFVFHRRSFFRKLEETRVRIAGPFLVSSEIIGTKIVRAIFNWNIICPTFGLTKYHNDIYIFSVKIKSRWTL